MRPTLLLVLALALPLGQGSLAQPLATRGEHSQSSPGMRSLDSLAEGALSFDDLGTYHYPVTTTSREAQAYFDQGLRLTYAFNHDEAARSFARAAQLDPSCAMCFWGVALVLGPNYNVPMLPDRAATAWEGLQRAVALAPRPLRWSRPSSVRSPGATAGRSPETRWR